MTSLLQRVKHWLVPRVPEAIRVDFERRQHAGVQQHVPMIYSIASVNVLIDMAVCAHTGVEPRYYTWMAGLVLLAFVRTLAWLRTRRAVLSPSEVTVALRRSSLVAVASLFGMGAFASYTFVSGAFFRSTLIPVSLAFGAMSIAHCFATVRLSAVAALMLGIVPSSVAMLAVGDFNARVLGLSMLSVVGLMIHFISVQFDHLVVELELQREVHALANTDALTQLLNRRALVALVERELGRPGNVFALALLDLDGFKGVNDRLGHLAGDDLLRVVGQRLATSCGTSGTVARLGGDEFVVVFHAVRGDDDLRARIATLLKDLCQPTQLATEEVMVRASLGAALFPRDGATTPDLLGAADAALYANKRARTLSGDRVPASAEGVSERRRNRKD